MYKLLVKTCDQILRNFDTKICAKSDTETPTKLSPKTPQNSTKISEIFGWMIISFQMQVELFSPVLGIWKCVVLVFAEDWGWRMVDVWKE